MTFRRNAPHFHGAECAGDGGGGDDDDDFADEDDNPILLLDGLKSHEITRERHSILSFRTSFDARSKSSSLPRGLDCSLADGLLPENSEPKTVVAVQCGNVPSKGQTESKIHYDFRLHITIHDWEPDQCGIPDRLAMSHDKSLGYPPTHPGYG